MKSAERLTLRVEQMREAAGDACRYVDGLNFAAFARDKRNQQAVVLNLLLIGEVASRIVECALGFIAAHPEIPGGDPGHAQPDCSRLLRARYRGGVGHGS